MAATCRPAQEGCDPMGTSTDPVYLRVLEDLRSQIREGVLPPGARVPSRAAIMTRYGVGETAAKHALAVLATEGLIESRPGSGSYAQDPGGQVPRARQARVPRLALRRSGDADDRRLAARRRARDHDPPPGLGAPDRAGSRAAADRRAA